MTDNCPPPVVWMRPPSTLMPTKLPVDEGVCRSAYKVRLPSTVVNLAPLFNEILSAVVSEIAPAPVVETSLRPVLRSIVPLALTVRFFPVASEKLSLKVMILPVRFTSPGRLSGLLKSKLSAPEPVFTVRLPVNNDNETNMSFPFPENPPAPVIPCVGSLM